MATRRCRSAALPPFHPTARCACGNRLFVGELGVCAACRLVQWQDRVEQTYARRQVGLRERIAARWSGYDAVGQWDETAETSPDGLAAHVEIERRSDGQAAIDDAANRAVVSGSAN